MRLLIVPRMGSGSSAVRILCPLERRRPRFSAHTRTGAFFPRRASFSRAVLPALGFDDFLGGQLVGGVVKNIVGGVHCLSAAAIRNRSFPKT